MVSFSKAIAWFVQRKLSLAIKTIAFYIVLSMVSDSSYHVICHDLYEIKKRLCSRI